MYFWTEGDRDFIFSMHIQLIMPFQMTPRSITLTLTFLDFVATGGIVFHKYIYIFFIQIVK